jgi:HEAT repeat protein
MSPLTVFFRTLLKSSAIFIGTAAIFLHPSLEWRGGAADRTTVGAQQGAHDAAVTALIAALKDADQGVRVKAIDALGEIGDARALDALTAALKDTDVTIRRHAATAIAQLTAGGGGHAHPAPHPHPHPHPHAVVRQVAR